MDKWNSLKLSQMNNLNEQMIVKKQTLAATNFSEITYAEFFSIGKKNCGTNPSYTDKGNSTFTDEQP